MNAFATSITLPFAWQSDRLNDLQRFYGYTPQLTEGRRPPAIVSSYLIRITTESARWGDGRGNIIQGLIATFGDRQLLSGRRTVNGPASGRKEAYRLSFVPHIVPYS